MVAAGCLHETCVYCCGYVLISCLTSQLSLSVTKHAECLVIWLITYYMSVTRGQFGFVKSEVFNRGRAARNRSSEGCFLVRRLRTIAWKCTSMFSLHESSVRMPRDAPSESRAPPRPKSIHLHPRLQHTCTAVSQYSAVDILVEERVEER